MSNVKHIIKQLVPPVFISALKTMRTAPASDNTFTGNYANWDEALKESQGYQQESILEKVKAGALRVKNGEAAYERDSVVFNRIEYSWELLAGLLRIAAFNKNKLSVLDFGGSLGTTFFQNKKMLSSLEHLEWSIVEQPHFVKCGQDFFADDCLKFYFSIEDCMKERKPDVILLSGVLQYLENPDAIAGKIIDSKINHLIIDKTLVSIQDDRIMIQHAPESIYKASYPVRFFSEKNLISKFCPVFEVMAEFELPAEYNSAIRPFNAAYKGFILQRKK